MLIINTAGHIDHGKSSIIKALNGFDGDSTQEEIRRAITIDLSFSNLEDVSFIDVPGHENLLKTMVLGVQSEYAMLVVDINEGLKEQSKEHILILKILDVKNIILVLNKIDLCKNIDEKKAEILSSIDFKPLQTFLVSAKTNEGIDDLKHFILNLKRPQYIEDDFVRIFIDRVFNVKGQGNVATGILRNGAIKENLNLVNENNENVQIKQIQVQHKNTDCAYALSRVAFTYKGKLEKNQILAKKGYLRKTKTIYASINTKLKHLEKVLFCCGSKIINATYYEFGEYARFELEQECAFCFDDAYIVLKNSRFAAGGKILLSVVEPLKKQKLLELLNLLNKKDFYEVFKFLSKVHIFGFGLFCSKQRFNLDLNKALNIAQELNLLFDKDKACLYSHEALEKTSKKIKQLFDKNKYSMQSANSLSKSLEIDSFLCDIALKNMQDLECKNKLYFKKGLDYEELNQNIKDILFSKLDLLTPNAPYNIYDELNLDRKQGDLLMKELCARNLIIRLAHNYFLSKRALDEFVQKLTPFLKKGLDVQELKNNFNLSRKYAIAILDYLSTQKNIKNIDNKRFLI
ncbi:selenocysteine-specific translation elongation factor [Campylobacter canadensis]|uniref:SelB C-terminal domain-containing protein n=1 Tax=Campylobacter canadensis TaxID=449520 RepID=A0ABS7WVB9_9BACT|nr:selenocysteine-specific translation elongation factor [Campylobacter canadensis]MBZ7987905.1 SelB C-terminal domain-containing protein [Campylobacter canadensis]MBZ7995355.1 SelB C-terminal domain-containing protein [Campylobacter canadensis]MBZ7996319.1 SelB C-terminal domain-containing protein [Campylobacter canadensis]MBZ7998351.1 SelB C-terminal domain-containing protein [Campylobacter canadensis]MBZ8000066.1 SelB C-terminal domain-containing protein [Campylobacter canadensis]